MNISASTVTITLTNREFELHPLTDRDWHSLTLWIRADFLRTADELAKTSDYWAQTMGLAMEQAKLVSWTDKTSRALLLTPIGNAKLFQLSCKSDRVSMELAESLFKTSEVEMEIDHEKTLEFYFLFSLINDLDIGVKEPSSEPRKQYSTAEIELAREDRYQRLSEKSGIPPTVLADHTPVQLETIDRAMRMQTFGSQEEHDAYMNNVNRGANNGQ